MAEKENKPMDQLMVTELKSVDQRFGEDVVEVFDYDRSVEMKASIGGTSKSAVREQIELLRGVVGGQTVKERLSVR